MLWAAAGFSAALAFVLAVAVIYESPQAPFALILYGPVAISCGVIVGTVVWRRREAKPNSSLNLEARQERPGAGRSPH